MTNYVFSTLTNGQVIPTFNPTSDSIIITGSDGPASALVIGYNGANSSIELGGKTVTFDGLNPASLTSTNFVSSEGTLYVAGGTGSVALENTPQTITISDNNSLALLEGGSDTVVESGTGTTGGQLGGNVIAGAGGNNSITGTNDISGSVGDSVHGGAGNDTINYSASTANNLIYGDNGNDTITGGTGTSTLNGGAGNDTIHVAAGVGNALLQGGAGNDSVLYVGTGTTTVSGDLGNDTLNVTGIGHFIVLGADGNDSISAAGSAGAVYNALSGGAGNDTISLSGANAFTATVQGGQGNDSIADTSTAGGHLIYTDQGNATVSVTGATVVDTIIGGSGNDLYVATGNTLASQWTLGSGNDTFTFGNTGAHTGLVVVGGSGADVYNYTTVAAQADSGTITNFGAGSDTLNLTTTAHDASAIISAGGSIVLSGSELTVTDGTDVLNLGLTGSHGVINVINGTTSATSSILYAYGSSGNTLTDTGTGSDVILGGTGNDTITSGVTAAGKADYISAGSGNDLVNLLADPTNTEVVHGGTGADTLSVQTANTVDFVNTAATGGASGFADIVLGGGTAHTLSFAAYSAGTGGISAGAVITVDGSSQSLGATITDSTTDSGVHFSVLGGSGADSIDLHAATLSATINGGTGADTLAGGTGADSVVGGTGALIIESFGNDTMTGGSGATTFQFGDAAASTDVITNFNTSDQLEFSAGVTTYDTTSFGTAAADHLLKSGGGAAVASVSAGGDTGSIFQAGTVATTVTQNANLVEFTGATYANASALQSQIQGNVLTVGNGGGVAGIFLAAYIDSTDGNVHIAEIHHAAAATTVGDTVTDLVVLSGVTSFANFVNGDFHIIA